MAFTGVSGQNVLGAKLLATRLAGEVGPRLGLFSWNSNDPVHLHVPLQATAPLEDLGALGASPGCHSPPPPHVVLGEDAALERGGLVPHSNLVEPLEVEAECLLGGEAR